VKHTGLPGWQESEDVFFNGVVLDTTGVNIDFLLINFRPGRTETNVVHGCATIFNGSKPLEMKESGSRIF
jgi:hypothetical protein